MALPPRLGSDPASAGRMARSRSRRSRACRHGLPSLPPLSGPPLSPLFWGFLGPYWAYSGPFWPLLWAVLAPSLGPLRGDARATLGGHWRTLAGPWPDPGRTLAGPWADPRRTLAGP